MGLGFKLKQQLKMLSQNVYLPAVYDRHRADKVESNLVVFADAHHDERPEAMELLYRMLRRSGEEYIHIVQMYLDFSKASSKQIFDFSTQFMAVYAKASVVVICDNFLPVASCRKKPETLVIQLWHGCGCYKKFGYDAEDDIPEGYKGDVFRNMDLVTVSSEAAVGPFCSAMHKRPALTGSGMQREAYSAGKDPADEELGQKEPVGKESEGIKSNREIKEKKASITFPMGFGVPDHLSPA